MLQESGFKASKLRQRQNVEQQIFFAIVCRMPPLVINSGDVTSLHDVDIDTIMNNISVERNECYVLIESVRSCCAGRYQSRRTANNEVQQHKKVYSG